MQYILNITDIMIL